MQVKLSMWYTYLIKTWNVGFSKWPQILDGLEMLFIVCLENRLQFLDYNVKCR